jgi:phosphatidylglycerophosphate synthase
VHRFTHSIYYYIINGITFYRVIAAPFLIYLLFAGHYDSFKWLILLSFFTDFIDGFLARKFKVTSVFGTRLDSIGDDLTILVAMLALFVMKPGFIYSQKIIFLSIGILFIVQTAFAFFRYGKITSFHTYLAKLAAILQGVFLLLVFFTGKPLMILFYAAAIVTILELIEETILVHLLRVWKPNVKGLYWVLMKKPPGKSIRNDGDM